jgi:hypothetical protein
MKKESFNKEFMNSIADNLGEFVVFFFIAITMPFWIFPYAIYRKIKKKNMKTNL